MNPDIFIQAFLARLVPIYHERLLGALRNFNIDAYPHNAALAAVGALLALALWYGVGVWLRRMPERVSTEEQRARIEAMRGAAREWLPWLLVLAPTPVGGVVVMAAAFFRLTPAKVAAIVVASEILWRAMPYLR